jgi:hypothetical protein
MMIRSPAEISTIMPSVESSTRMEYSKMRRDGSARNSVDRISVAGRADQRQDFQEAGKIVDDEAAAEGGELSGRQHSSRAATTPAEATASP